jgi:mitogen-activated protein kinase kinase
VPDEGTGRTADSQRALCMITGEILNSISTDKTQDHDAFLQAAKRTPVDLEKWAISMMEVNNRKSYLAPVTPAATIKEQLRERPAVERRGSADVKPQVPNGSVSAAPAPAPPRPSYPARTSSSTSLSQTQNVINLPIRPAPAPSDGPGSRPGSRGPTVGGGPQIGGLPPAPRRWNNEVQ